MADVDYEVALAEFVEFVKGVSDASRDRYSPSLPKEDFTVEPGRRFDRIVRSEGANHRAVYCFVEQSNGLIWKAATWKAPALNSPRGSVYDPASYAGFGPYGAPYVK